METPQVAKQHYDFLKYCDRERWNSYFCQIEETLGVSAETILEVGKGDGVYGVVMQQLGKSYTSLDIAADLHPDIIGSVLDMPIEESSYDVSCAFEVLEHLPFDNFIPALKEMARVSKKYVLISLPHWGRHFSLQLRLPGLGKIQAQIKLPVLVPHHDFDGQHYWEIGKKGYSLKKVRRAIKEAGLKIEKDYNVFSSPYHHFFVLSV